MDKEEHLDFTEDKVQELVNHIIRHDEGTKGSVRIDAKHEGDYDITVHTGPEKDITKIRGVDKEKVLELIDSNL